MTNRELAAAVVACTSMVSSVALIITHHPWWAGAFFAFAFIALVIGVLQFDGDEP